MFKCDSVPSPSQGACTVIQITRLDPSPPPPVSISAAIGIQLQFKAVARRQIKKMGQQIKEFPAELGKNGVQTPCIELNPAPIASSHAQHFIAKPGQSSA